MLPEIKYVRDNGLSRVVTPDELASEFPEKSKAAIDKALKRALDNKVIIKLGYGEYAHPNYHSKVPGPTPTTVKDESDWKNGTHASLIVLILNGMIKDYNDPHVTYWRECITPIFRLMAETLDDESIKNFATVLVRACRDKQVRDRIASDYASASVADWTERIRQEKS